MKKIHFLQLIFVVFIIFALTTFAQVNSTTSGSNSTSGTASTLTQCFSTFGSSFNTVSNTGLPTPVGARRMLQKLNNPLSAMKNITKNYQDFLTEFKPSELPNKGDSIHVYRNLIFNQNLQKMNTFNQNVKRTYNLGVNQFADLQQTQFIKIYSTLKIPTTTNGKGSIIVEQPIPVTPPPGNSTILPGVASISINKTTQLRTQPFVGIPENPTSTTISSSSSSTPGTLPKNIAQAAVSNQNLSNSSSLPTTNSTSSSNTSNTSSTPLLKEPLSNNLTNGSFVGGNLNYNPTQNGAGSSDAYTIPSSVSIDWSCKASPVMNQGLCGSCYIIAPLESIYMTMRIYNQTILPLSIQQLISCGQASNGLMGCQGGYFMSAFQYTKINGTGRAIMYPYNAQAINTGVATPCAASILNTTAYKNAKIKIRDSAFITFGDCAGMIEKLKTTVIAVSIATQNFQFYLNGTYSVSGQTPNHGVTLVGYNPTDGYKIKNSWGTGWGNAGYAYVSQTTGVCDFSMYPVTGFQDSPMGPCC